MHRNFFATGAAFAFLSVLIGAFGAHALQDRLTDVTRPVYETGVHYQFFHALGLIVLGLLWQSSPDKRLLLAGRLMTAGIVLFSFSLYGYALTQIRAIAIVTPFGGLCFLISWLLVVLWALTHEESKPA